MQCVDNSAAISGNGCGGEALSRENEDQEVG